MTKFMEQHCSRAWTILCVFALGIRCFAQPQLENPGFETWNNAGQATEEPSEWSSLKTSDGGALINSLVPQLCWRSDDAHTGTRSVNLRTVSSLAGDANGLLTNGRVHAEIDIQNSYMFTDQENAQWHTTLTSRPDSLVGWFKAQPEPGDRANIGALLHVSDGRLPAFGTEGNYVAGASWKAPYGEVASWTRFAVPFQYLNNTTPEYVLLILTAGDSAGSSVGTQVWYDDLALIYNVQCLPSEPTAYVSATEGYPVVVGYSTGGEPTTSTTFSVQLSDIGGSFAAPVVIGSVSTFLPTGSIPCTIPAGTLPGADYKLRVVGSSPFYAPVPVDFEVQATTGMRDMVANLPMWLVDGDVMVDARALGEGGLEYSVIDAQGRLASGGRVDGAGVLRILLPRVRGVYAVQLNSGSGRIVKRIVVP